MTFVLEARLPRGSTGFQEYISEVLHELRLPKEPRFPSHTQADEAAFMLHERTGITWQVQPLEPEAAEEGA